mgnify:CR=1 FL=1
MRRRCLVLDHDDTVVKSSPAIHYPSFVEALKILRPERADMRFDEFIRFSFDPGILPLLTEVLQLTEAEMRIEQEIWRSFTYTRTPDAYDGFAELFAEFRARGGKVSVVSHSERDVILRHYRELFAFEPDLVFGWELPAIKRKPHPYPLEETMREFGLEPEELLVVDDLKPGLDMANACGVDFAYAGWSHTAAAVGDRIRPLARHAFDSVGELAEFLEM